MAKYAAKTDVSEEKSRAEIETILRRYGADAFSYGWEENRALIAFRAHNRQIRFEIAMPLKDDPEIVKYTDRYGYEKFRSDSAALTEWNQARRQRWRALALVVKAKLEAVDCGIAEFEEEFLAHIVLPDGSTVGTQIKPYIEQAYLEGKMPKHLLLTAGAGA
jgi:hypothetical protein